MKKVFADFLFNFTSDENYFTEFEVTSDHKPLINKILKELTNEDYAEYVKHLGERWPLGFEFFDKCIDFVDEENKYSFLELVWNMFFDGMDSNKTDGIHPWMGQFNPINEKDGHDIRYARWFREGAVRFEINEDNIIESASSSVYPAWWNNFEHFLEEVCEFRNKDFLIALLTELSKRLKRREQLNLPNKKGKRELLKVFKTWAGSDLSYFDSEDLDWFDNSPFLDNEEIQ